MGFGPDTCSTCLVLALDSLLLCFLWELKSAGLRNRYIRSGQASKHSKTAFNCYTPAGPQLDNLGHCVEPIDSSAPSWLLTASSLELILRLHLITGPLWLCQAPPTVRLHFHPWSLWLFWVRYHRVTLALHLLISTLGSSTGSVSQPIGVVHPSSTMAPLSGDSILGHQPGWSLDRHLAPGSTLDPATDLTTLALWTVLFPNCLHLA
ncbi:hypothetical protein E1301_Tti020733 [Triplophysa tibetana]|uniref:Uncharacterized protein n=1 Tax=Triplophysa tibetana TaxID=1572043 RepID=A0A5A9P3U0_9TELE|nr:hypothetical protein E1301_Tti020733 [Triplophysa tibetana]